MYTVLYHGFVQPEFFKSPVTAVCCSLSLDLYCVYCGLSWPGALFISCFTVDGDSLLLETLPIPRFTTVCYSPRLDLYRV